MRTSLRTISITQGEMKPELYEPIAQEAFGRSLLDISDSLIKGAILLFTLAPATYIVQSAFQRPSATPSFSELLQFFYSWPYMAFVFFLLTTILLAGKFRHIGLRHINESAKRNSRAQKCARKAQK